MMRKQHYHKRIGKRKRVVLTAFLTSTQKRGPDAGKTEEKLRKLNKIHGFEQSFNWFRKEYNKQILDVFCHRRSGFCKPLSS